ncbi:MAG TPA: ATP synthase subunit I [bacterium]|nr:ATP synthase subunit I [bacterium]HPQ19430.1 ATP synthase subunit I [bacterium]
MQQKKEVTLFQNKISKTILICIFISVVISLILKRIDYLYGFVLGGFTGLLNFRLLVTVYNRENFAINLRKNLLQKFFIRYIIFGCALAIAGWKKDINIITTAIGFFFVQISIFINAFLEKKI